MREIKFRQPVTRNEVFQGWHYWGYVSNNLDAFTTPLSSNDGEIKKSYQLTGLQDKNGKEIYEGDVVKTPQQKYIKQWVVEYDYDGNLILSNQINSEMSLYDFEDMILNKENCYIKDIEVIGNIFENPELIN